MASEDSARSRRELFWLRLTAGVIDVVAAVVIASAAGALLYAVSDGKLRSSSFLKVAHCRAMSSISASMMEGVPTLPGARPVAAQLCTISLLGAETARYVTVALQAQSGEVTRSLAFSRPVDSHNLPVKPVVLDWVYPLAFLLIMSLSDTLFGTTLGKRLVGLRLGAGSGGRLPLYRALARNAIIYGGAALALVAPLLVTLAGFRISQAEYYVAVAVMGLLVFAPFAMLAQASPRALYDRWTGAEVTLA